MKGHTTTVTCRWLVVSHLFGTTFLHWHSIHNTDTFAVHANILSSMHSFLSPLLHLFIFSRIQHLCVCACVRAFDCPFAQHEPLPQPPPAAAAQVLDASLDIAMLWDGQSYNYVWLQWGAMVLWCRETTAATSTITAITDHFWPRLSMEMTKIHHTLKRIVLATLTVALFWDE